MALSFKEYSKNPIQYLLFICIGVIGYLYVDQRQVLNERIDQQEKEIVQLREDYKELSEKLFEILKETN